MDVAAMQDRLAPLFPGLMGVRLVELAADRVVAEMPVRADLLSLIHISEPTRPY